MGAGQCGHPAGGPGGCDELIVTPRSTFAALPSLARRRLPLSGVSCPARGRKCSRPANGLDHYFWLTLMPLRGASDAGGNIELLCRLSTFFFREAKRPQPSSRILSLGDTAHAFPSSTCREGAVFWLCMPAVLGAGRGPASNPPDSMSRAAAGRPRRRLPSDHHLCHGCLNLTGVGRPNSVVVARRSLGIAPIYLTGDRLTSGLIFLVL